MKRGLRQYEPIQQVDLFLIFYAINLHKTKMDAREGSRWSTDKRFLFHQVVITPS